MQVRVGASSAASQWGTGANPIPWRSVDGSPGAGDWKAQFRGGAAAEAMEK